MIFFRKIFLFFSLYFSPSLSYYSTHHKSSKSSVLSEISHPGFYLSKDVQTSIWTKQLSSVLSKSLCMKTSQHEIQKQKHFKHVFKFSHQTQPSILNQLYYHYYSGDIHFGDFKILHDHCAFYWSSEDCSNLPLT